MAESDSKAARKPEVEAIDRAPDLHDVERSEGVYWDEFIGSRDALVRAGVADPSQFPGDPGNRKTAQTYRDAGLKVRISKRNHSIFVVWRWLSGADGEARAKARMAEYREEQRIIMEAQQAKRDLALLPASADAFGKSFRQMSSFSLQSIRAHATEGDGGYKVSRESAQEIEDALGDLWAAILRSEIVFSRRDRDTQTLRYRASAAAGDPAFRAFMGSVRGGLGETDEPEDAG